MRGRELEKERKVEGIEIQQGRRERQERYGGNGNRKNGQIGSFYTRVHRSVVCKSASGGVLC